MGDKRPAIQAHETIERALRHAGDALSLDVETEFLSTGQLTHMVAEQLLPFDALWFGPCSPYENFDGALRAIRFARESGLPFLGTCAGFQHALIEFARSVLGLIDADHAETNAAAAEPLIAQLPVAMIERTSLVRLDPNSRVATLYKRTEVAERYRCEFGLNPRYLSMIHRGGFRVSGVTDHGTACAIEYSEHPFFIATLFLPECTTSPSAPHPLVLSWLTAAKNLRSAKNVS
ncbi:MAG: hypothetical protein H7Z74_14620 [Anaerolineae bacterium]|nr:hypothetical protein [Gemmatimonadaceae bacterium]